MPRPDLETPLDLDAGRLDKLAKALTPLAQSAVMRCAMQRYPGGKVFDDFVPENAPPGRVIRLCLDEVRSETMLRPFLSRVIEHQWKLLPLREEMLRVVPDLALAPSGLAGAAQAVTKGIQKLLELIADPPALGHLGTRPGDDKSFRMVCSRRDLFIALRDALKHLKALKSLHDALHILQITSADWLEEDAPEEAFPVPPLLDKVRAARAIVQTESVGLADGHVALGAEIASALDRIAQWLAEPDTDANAAGIEALRSLLLNKPRELDAGLLAISQFVPWREISFAFLEIHDSADPDYAMMSATHSAVWRLGEALRGRILEHALWQETDLNVSGVEQLFEEREPGFLIEFNKKWQQIRSAIRYLAEGPLGDPPPDTMVGMAINIYVNATSGGPAAPGAVEALDEIYKTFNSFKALPRERFLSVDLALKADLALLDPLRELLDELIERRVGIFCQSLLPIP